MIKRNLIHNILLTLIILLGISLRIVGINWGLNNTKYFHGYSYHPDEQFPLNELKNMIPNKLDFCPKGIQALATGSLIVYTTGIALAIGNTFGFVRITQDYEFYKSHPEKFNNVYLVGRVVSIFFGIASIFLIYLIGKKFYNQQIALISSVFLAITPLHVVFSHYLSRDSMQCFWILVILYFSYKILYYNQRSTFFWTGIFTGICISTKYNGAIVIVVPLTALMVNIFSSKIKIISRDVIYKILFLLIGVFISFAITNPYFFTNFNEYRKFFNENTYQNLLQTLSYANISEYTKLKSGIIFYLFDAQYYAFGIFFWILSLLSMINNVLKKEKDGLMLVSFVVVYCIILVMIKNWLIVRWVLPLLPMYCILSAKIIFELLQKQKIYKIMGIIILVLVTGYNLLYSMSYVKMLASKNTHDISSEFIEQSIPENEKIGSYCAPYVWYPTIVQMNYWYKPEDVVFKNVKRYKIINLDGKVENLIEENPQYIVLSEYHFYPPPELHSYKYESINIKFSEEVVKRYDLVKKFEIKPEIFGFYPVGKKPLPHDLKYVDPTIFLYKFKNYGE